MLLVFLLPALLYVAAWRILPALYTAYLSFTSYNLAYDPSLRWTGFANYARLARESGLLSSFTVTMEFTIIVTLAELALGLLTALVLLFIGFQIPLVMWILATYLQTLPKELVEAALLDGASLPVIAMRIILPLAAPGLVSAAILSFIFNWNEFLFPLVLTSFDAKTGAVAIMNYLETEKDVLWGPLSTVGVAMTIPVVLFMVLLRTHLVRGLTAGMLKG